MPKTTSEILRREPIDACLNELRSQLRVLETVAPTADVTSSLRRVVDLLARAVKEGEATPAWVPLEAAARHLGEDPEAVRYRVRRGYLTGRKVGRRWYVSAPSLARRAT